MDRYYWMYKAPRMSKPYLNGVENFISVAEANRVNNGSRSISCPCNNCKNFLSFIDTGEIEYHLLHDGFVPNYTCWSRHGESLLDCSASSNNLHSNENTFNNDSYLDDDDHHSNERNDNFNEMFDDMETNMGADEQEKLHRLFDEAETPLYKGSRFMKLDVVLKLLNLKLKHGWSDKSFTSLLELLHDLFPEDNGLPISTYQAKKLMCPMGLEVERIHACPNNCMLFRKEFENKHNCVSCGASRYKRKKDSDEVDDDVTKNGPPAKMLWYLPIIPRLKRLFSNENEAKLLCWHSEERVIDGKLRHVADSPQWRNIDNKYPEFGNEMRNIRVRHMTCLTLESVGVPKTRHSGRLEGKGGVGSKIIMPTREELQVAHLVVLKHMTCLTPYIDEHMDMLKSRYPGKEESWYINNHNKELSRWLREKVTTTNVDETVKKLGQGPDFRVQSYQGYDINGYTFYTKDQDQKSTMQNSGVTMIATTTEFDRQDHDTFYGVIQEIWELKYFDFIVPVFRCKWVNNRTGVQVDKYGFTLVDLTTNGYASEPFVLAKHAAQVFFVKEPSKARYHVVFQGKRCILGVDNVVDEEEYDHFDDLPPFSVGIEPTNFENRTTNIPLLERKPMKLEKDPISEELSGFIYLAKPLKEEWMDRYYWMYKAPRMSKPYLNGVENFISVAEANRVNNGSRSISYPCNNCKNFLSFIDTGEIEYHLLHDGFVPNYTCWSRHGESLLDCSTSSNNLHSNENTFNNDSYLDDDDHHSNERNDNFNEMFDDMETNMGADEQEKLHRLFDEAETPLYKGSRFMKLDVVLKLLNLKLKHGWSDKSFTSLLELLHDLFPEDNGLPISTYQAKKLMCPMGLEVERIHACPNNCMLFRKEFENKHNCVSCGASRYKRKKDSDEVDDDVTKNGPPAKMLWYLPIIPRLKRLFSNENEAKLLCWHSEERVIDGKLRHVADSPQVRHMTCLTLESVGVPKTRHSGRLEGKGGVGSKIIMPTREELQVAHLVVLKHMTCLTPYIDEHMDMLKSRYPGKEESWYINNHNKELSRWLREKVTTTNVDETVRKLGQGPDFRVQSYQGYDINGYTFYTKDQDQKSTMQNSGVTMIATTTEFDRQDHDTFYGVIQEIWELKYFDFIVPVFRCKWVNNRTGVQVDKYGFTLVDLTTNGYASEPFVLAKHAPQVFFVKDSSKARYHIVLQGKRRILGVDNVVDEEEYDHFDDLPPFSVGIEPTNFENRTTYVRSGVEGTYVK
ncbi:hypothetical protein LXL04_027410 [Taraxacum kok-saghyz]